MEGNVNMSNNQIVRKQTTEIAKLIDEAAIPFIEINNRAVAAGRTPPFANPRLEAIKYELVRRPDGMIAKKERKEPLIIEVGEVDPSVRVGRMDSEKVLSTRGTGKYNDEHRLALSDSLGCSIEVGEVLGFRDCGE